MAPYSTGLLENQFFWKGRRVPQPPRNGGAKLFIRAPRTFSFNSRNAQHSQSLGDVGAMGVWMNVFVHVENAAILPDVKSPAVRKSCGTQHAVRPCNPFIRIAQNGIVEPERLRELRSEEHTSELQS